MENADTHTTERKPMNTKIAHLLAWIRQGRKNKTEENQTDVGLPKDADGHDIPLDTKILYDITGHMWRVGKFSYSVITGGKWRVQFEDGICYFHTNCETYLTRPDN